MVQINKQLVNRKDAKSHARSCGGRHENVNSKKNKKRFQCNRKITLNSNRHK